MCECSQIWWYMRDMNSSLYKHYETDHYSDLLYEPSYMIQHFQVFPGVNFMLWSCCDSPHYVHNMLVSFSLTRSWHFICLYGLIFVVHFLVQRQHKEKLCETIYLHNVYHNYFGTSKRNRLYPKEKVPIYLLICLDISWFKGETIS